MLQAGISLYLPRYFFTSFLSAVSPGYHISGHLLEWCQAEEGQKILSQVLQLLEVCRTTLLIVVSKSFDFPVIYVSPIDVK